MKITTKFIRIAIPILASILLALGLGLSFNKDTNATNATYKILAWNDLGMHCYNLDFSDLAVLPPYNTLWVQVLQAGDPPKLVTTGITVSYSYADNTYSVGKTNFWTYAKALFGVQLAPNIGLKGKGLSGNMDLAGDHFVAEGIPVTEYSDSATTTRQPYQLATVVVKDSSSGEVLATQSVVTPTSSEMRCDKCHSDNGEAAPDKKTGIVARNILQKHDEEEGTQLMANRPVLCASCHGSNALGAPGKPGIPNLSRAMHRKHDGEIPNTLNGCYNCHPGPTTQCLRDVMSQKSGMDCIDCHGTMAKVATNPSPWLNEPRCDSCHNSGKFNQNNGLYRFSTGHGDLYCEACHDSTHAIAPSREARDAIKFMALQGKAGPLSTCSVCHTGTIDLSKGPHSSNPNTITHVISGNAGAAGVTLSYTNGGSKTVTSNANGNFSITIPDGWSGKIIPTKTGVIGFSPAARIYSIVKADKTAQNFKTNQLSSFVSNAIQDGYVRALNASNNTAGLRNSSGSAILVGDDAQNRQFRGFLSFDTSNLPDNAVIVAVRVKLKLQATVGTNPTSSLGALAIDIRKPYFGNSLLLSLADFNAPASLNAAGKIGSSPLNGFYSGLLGTAAYPSINLTGLTQLRLRFQTATNNNAANNYFAFYSGNVPTTSLRPVLEITYHLP